MGIIYPTLRRAFIDADRCCTIICPSGFAYLRARGDIVCRYSDVRRIWFLITNFAHSEPLAELITGRAPTPLYTTYHYVIETTDGQKIDLPNAVGGIKELGERLVREVTTAELPRARAALDRGESVDFAVIELTSEGIRVKGKTLRWQDFTGVRVHQGDLSLLDRDGKVWQVIGVSAIANYHVLHALLQR